jgi:hypothetical protein
MFNSRNHATSRGLGTCNYNRVSSCVPTLQLDVPHAGKARPIRHRLKDTSSVSIPHMLQRDRHRHEEDEMSCGADHVQLTRRGEGGYVDADEDEPGSELQARWLYQMQNGSLSSAAGSSTSAQRQNRP